jgi:hypothetical protein
MVRATGLLVAVRVPATSPGSRFRTSGDADVRHLGFQDGAQVYDVSAGRATFRRVGA